MLLDFSVYQDNTLVTAEQIKQLNHHCNSQDTKMQFYDDQLAQ